MSAITRVAISLASFEPFRVGPATSWRRSMRVLMRRSCSRRKPTRSGMMPFSPMPRSISIVTPGWWSRSAFDAAGAYTQKALVAQHQAAVAHDEAVIDNAKFQLDYTTITLPLAGRLGLRLIDQSYIVHATDSTGLVVVMQLQPIAVIFTLPQQHLLPIAEAMRRGELTVIAYDQDNKVKLAEGHLALIDNQVD
jgi:multidrug efflux pump subunit AcrA (membrane-fusion protein)